MNLSSKILLATSKCYSLFPILATKIKEKILSMFNICHLLNKIIVLDIYLCLFLKHFFKVLFKNKG